LEAEGDADESGGARVEAGGFGIEAERFLFLKEMGEVLSFGGGLGEVIIVRDGGDGLEGGGWG
jgi:hypothetical protein